MACGTPVLVANCGALCEVVREAGLVFDLFQDGSLSNTMFEYLANKTLRTSMREKGLARASSFSWQSTADLIWKTLHEI
jgi:glycosyltransferase involved in cell wall biosynthesis